MVETVNPGAASIKRIHPFECVGVSTHSRPPLEKKPVTVFLGVRRDNTTLVSCPYLDSTLICTAPKGESLRRVCPYVYPHQGTEEVREERKPWESVPVRYGRLMSLLEAYAGEFVTYEAIIEAVWPGKSIDPQAVRKLLYQLDQFNPEFRKRITVFPGRGLRYDSSMPLPDVSLEFREDAEAKNWQEIAIRALDNTEGSETKATLNIEIFPAVEISKRKLSRKKLAEAHHAALNRLVTG